MARLIDADALTKSTEEWYCKDCNHYNYVRCRACQIADALNSIESAPTVEAIPLEPLARWLAGYAAPPRDAMRSTIPPGGSITHETLTAAWEKTLRELPL